jgi:hypothetical protein
MFDRACEHVGDRLDAAVRVPREPGEVVVRILVAEVVQQQERIEVARVAETEGAAQPDARTFDRGFAFELHALGNRPDTDNPKLARINGCLRNSCFDEGKAGKSFVVSEIA